MKKQPKYVKRVLARAKLYDSVRAELRKEYDAALAMVRAQCDHEKANAVLAARDEALAAGRRTGRVNIATAACGATWSRRLEAIPRSSA